MCASPGVDDEHVARPFTYDAGNHQRLQGLRSSNPETTVFRPSAPINRRIAEVWVPWAKNGTAFFVRFEFYSGAVLRAFADSRDFSIPARLAGETRGPWCRPLAQRGT